MSGKDEKTRMEAYGRQIVGKCRTLRTLSEGAWPAARFHSMRIPPSIYLDQADKDAALGITGAKASRNPRQIQRTSNAFRPSFLQPNSAPFPDDVATPEGLCPPNPSIWHSRRPWHTARTVTRRPCARSLDRCYSAN